MALNCRQLNEMGSVVMKVPGRIGVSVLITFFWAAGLCYGQSAAMQHLIKGVDYAAQGKFEEAKEEFGKVSKADPLYESVQEDLKVIEDVIDKKITSKTAIHLYKGVTYVHKRQYDQAISDYTKAIEINPRFAMAYRTRGTAYFRKRQYDQAISDYTKAIEINPRYARAYYSRGLAYEEGKGQYDQAISDYTKAIEINPRYVDAYNNRGFIYMVRLEDKKKACADWKRACELGSCCNYKIARRSGDCE
jgi:tetratricopeptide (TPR) repeat protein